MKTILLLIAVLCCVNLFAQELKKDTIILIKGDTIACKILNVIDNKILYLLPDGSVVNSKLADVNYYVQHGEPAKQITKTNNNLSQEYCGNYLKRASKRIITGISLNIAAGGVALIGMQLSTDYQTIGIIAGAISLSGIITIICGVADIGQAGYMLSPNSSFSLNTTKNGLTFAYKF